MRDGNTATKKCAGCGGAISGNMKMAVKLPGTDGKTFPVCSDKCGKKVWDSLSAANAQRISRDTDQLLRTLGIA